MKTAISIPNDLFQKADALAQRLGKSRSELYAAAVRDYVLQHDPESITARINELADEVNADPDTAWAREYSAAILQREPWP